jgi:hypothetical protein
VPSNNYSVRWQGRFSFNAGNYAFSATTFGGMRIYVDGVLASERWTDGVNGLRLSFDRAMTAGQHLITVEYFESTGGAAGSLNWAQR